MLRHAGFTLIELLVVIAIIAVLAVVVVLALNPAGLLQESRDANRLSDMATINNGINLISADVFAINTLGSVNTVYVSIPDPTATSTAGDQCQGLGLSFLPTGWTYHCSSSSTFRKTDGTGWIPVNFSSATFGAPFPQLPVDPINTSSTSLYYTYVASPTQWELTNMMESQKNFARQSNDGGADGYLYEVGSNVKLDPYMPRGASIVSKNPASVKILVIECASNNCTSYLNQLTTLGFTNVTVATSTASEAQVVSFNPDIVMALDTAWGVTNSALFNQLYNDGFHVFTEGNDTSNSIIPITSFVVTSAASGLITPFGNHLLAQGWVSTPNSGSDNRDVPTVLNPNAFIIAKDSVLGNIEVIYLEETGKGRWFDYQPYGSSIDNVLFQNALFYLSR